MALINTYGMMGTEFYSPLRNCGTGRRGEEHDPHGSARQRMRSSWPRSDFLLLREKAGTGPYGWPGHGHHETPSILVHVSDDGQTAMMSAPYVIAGINEKGKGTLQPGATGHFSRKLPKVGRSPSCMRSMIIRPSPLVVA